MLAVFNVVVEQPVHYHRGLAGVSLLGYLLAVIYDNIVFAVGNIVVGIGLVVKSAVAHIRVSRRHLSDGNTAVHTADRERTGQVGVFLLEVFKAHLGDRLLIGYGRTADKLHYLYRRCV